VLEPAFPSAALAEALAKRKQLDAGTTIFVSFREMDGTQLTELTAQAELGMTAFLGRLAEPPLRMGLEVVSSSAGILATQAVLAALRVRAETGRGQQIRVPMSRAAAGVLNNVTTASIQPDQPAHFSQGWSHDPALGLLTADGAVEVLFYGPEGERGFPEFCKRLGAEAVGVDDRFTSYPKRLDHGSLLAIALTPAARGMSRDALVALVRECGGMAMPKHDVVEAREWVQTTANAMVDGAAGARLPTAPWQVNGVRPSAGGMA